MRTDGRTGRHDEGKSRFSQLYKHFSRVLVAPRKSVTCNRRCSIFSGNLVTEMSILWRTFLDWCVLLSRLQKFSALINTIINKIDTNQHGFHVLYRSSTRCSWKRKGGSVGQLSIASETVIYTREFCEISIFQRAVLDVFTLVGRYVVQLGSWSPTFRDNQSIPYSRVSHSKKN
jgi:hypothetical protein